MFKSLRFFKIIFWYCSILFSCLPKSFPGYAMGQRAKGRPARSTSGGKREDFGAKCCGALRVDADLWGERCLERNFRWVWASIRAIRVEYVIVCESPKVEWFTPKSGVSHGSFYWTRDPLWDGWPVFHDGFAASPNCVDPMMSRWSSTTECLALATIVVVKVDFSDLDQLIINYRAQNCFLKQFCWGTVWNPNNKLEVLIWTAQCGWVMHSLCFSKWVLGGWMLWCWSYVASVLEERGSWLPVDMI